MAEEMTENSNTDTQTTETQADNAKDTSTTQNPEPGTIAGAAGETKPGAPESYDFKSSLPEGAELDETTAKEFGDICRGMKLTNDQANELAKYGYNYAQNIAQAMEDARTQQVEQWGEAAKKELGTSFDSTVSLCGQGIEAIEKEVPGIRQALNETGAGNRIEVIRALAMLGKMVQEDRGPGGTPSVGKTDNMYPNTDWNNL